MGLNGNTIYTYQQTRKDNDMNDKVLEVIKTLKDIVTDQHKEMIKMQKRIFILEAKLQVYAKNVSAFILHGYDKDNKKINISSFNIVNFSGNKNFKALTETTSLPFFLY